MRMFAGFLDRLREVQEGGEPLLDRTMVLFGSGMSYGHSHANSNLPILLAGGRGLGLRHGRHIDYNHPKGHAYTLSYEEWRGLCGRPRDGKARLSNVMLTMLQKMGVRAERFVDSTGPVSEVRRDPVLRRRLPSLRRPPSPRQAREGGPAVPVPHRRRQRRPALVSAEAGEFPPAGSAPDRRRTGGRGLHPPHGPVPHRPTGELSRVRAAARGSVEYLNADADLRDLPLGTAF